MGKRISLRMTAVILLVAAVFTLFSCNRRAEEDPEYERQLAALINEKQILLKEREALQNGMSAAVGRCSFMSFIFTELDDGLYNDVFPIFSDGEPIVGVMALSEDELPGLEGRVTREQFDRLVGLGWGTALYWDGEGSLVDFLDSMRAKLSVLGIDMPSSLVFKAGMYELEYDSVLESYGIFNAFHGGDADFSLVDSSDPEGTWHPGIIGWRNLQQSTRLKQFIETKGGYSAFQIVFDNSPENHQTAFYHIEGESTGNGLRPEVFARMIKSFKKSIEKGTMRVLNIDDTRVAVGDYYEAKDKYLTDAELRYAEIAAEILEIEGRITQLYDLYH